MGGKNKLLSVIFIIGGIVIIGIAAAINIMSKTGATDDNVMCQGVQIDGVDVGGMTEEEAEEAINKHIEDTVNRPVTVIINGNTVETTFAELGFASDGDTHVAEAFKEGKPDGFMERIFGSASKNDKEYNLSYNLDKDAIQKFVEEKCTVFDVRAKNSRLKYRKNGKFKATRDRTGIKLQFSETVDKIIGAIEGNLTDESVEVEAVVKTTEPKYTREVMSRCRDMIGSYSTTFST